MNDNEALDDDQLELFSGEEQSDEIDSSYDCRTHGLVELVSVNEASGFTGAPIWFLNLSCGCQDVDASEDTLEAVR